MQRLLIVGAGGHGQSIADAVEGASQYQCVGFVDDAAAESSYVCDLPVWGATVDLARYRAQADVVIVAVGNNQLREALHRRVLAAGFLLATVVHARAVVSPRAVVGAGCAIMAGAIVGAHAELGEGVILNSGAVVYHHCRVLDFAHLGVNAAMAGGSGLGRSAWMQAGAVLGYGVQVASNTVLAPGTALCNR